MRHATTILRQSDTEVGSQISRQSQIRSICTVPKVIDFPRYTVTRNKAGKT